jgi:hypothetical protein
MAGGGAAAIIAISSAIRALWRFNKRIVHIAEAVTELSPNSGHSIKDVVTRMDQNLNVLTLRFNDHLSNHSGGDGNV